MVTIFLLISISSSPLTKLLGIVPSTPSKISIIIIFMFHSLFSSLAMSKNLSPFSFSLVFTLWSARTVKSTIRQVLFFFFYILSFSRHYSEWDQVFSARILRSILAKFSNVVDLDSSSDFQFLLLFSGSLSSSCSITPSALRQSLSINPVFCFLLLLHLDLQEKQS